MGGRRRQGSDGIMLLCLDTVGLAADSDTEPRPADTA